MVTAAIAVANRMEDPVKLTDTQLLLLSAASQRDDRALEPSPKLTGGAAGKVVAKLLTEGLVARQRRVSQCSLRQSRHGGCAAQLHPFG